METDLAVLLLVEGFADLKFVVDLIYDLTASPKKKIGRLGNNFKDEFVRDKAKSGAKTKWRITSMGGKDKFGGMKINMQTFRDTEGAKAKIIVILDADNKPDDRHNEVKKLQAKFGFDDYFLIPDNKNAGTVETLLEAITVDEHRHIFECFDRFEECLKKQDKDYITPLSKSRVHAYCETLQGANLWASDRDYRNPYHWNLESSALNPFKQFLAKYLYGADAEL